MLYLDLKYVSFIGHKLNRFRQVGDYLWNFRCPICGDSQKSKTKARAYFFSDKDNIRFKCHNCGVASKLSSFLETIDPGLYAEYRMDHYREKHSINVVKPPTQVPKIDVSTELILRSFDRISDLQDDHPAVTFCRKRLIPKDKFSDLYYIDGFKNLKIDNNSNDTDDVARLVIPIRNEAGRLVALTGRAIGKNNKRYLIEKLDRTAQLVYNIDKVDFNKPVFVLEGPIDSMFLPNAIAAIGTSFGKMVNHPRFDMITFIIDNQPRNKEVVGFYEKLIRSKANVFFWPNTVEAKDINDFVLSGFPISKLPKFIKDNTYNGLSATTRLSNWKKV